MYNKEISVKFFILFLTYFQLHISLTLPSRDLKACLISCLCALLLCAIMSMIASSSVPVAKIEVVSCQMCFKTLLLQHIYCNNNLLPF